MAICLVEQCSLREFGKGHYEEHLCEINFDFGPVVREMSFQDISIFGSGGHFVSPEPSHLCNFSRGHYGDCF